jgi:SRSO17 transposase
MEVFPSIEDLRTWADLLEEVQERLAPYFERAEPRQRAIAYIRGLISTTERKNGWQLAELAGEATPDGMQRLLNTAKWDADQVRDDLQTYILTHLADPEAVLVVDETGFVKKGNKSAGVAAQYSGTVGKIATSQIGVFLAYANRYGAVLLDRELYLHADWEKDPKRCKEAEIPEERRSTIPKPMLARQMLERAFAHGIKTTWVTGDTVYGGDSKLRIWLEELLQSYVLAVPKNQRIGLSHRADEVVASWPAEVGGSACRQERAARGRACMIGPGRSFPFAGRSQGGNSGYWLGGVCLIPPRSPTTSSLLPSRYVWNKSCGLQAADGRWKKLLNWPNSRLGWMNTKCGIGKAGIGISPWRCLPWPF